MTSQLNLFDRPTLNVLREVKERMATAARDCGMSREQLVDAMNDLAARYGVCLVGGRNGGLTRETLEKWLNQQDREHCPSLKALPVFCAAVRDTGAMQALVQPLGWQVINEQDARLLQWAKLYHSAKDVSRRMKKLEAEL